MVGKFLASCGGTPPFPPVGKALIRLLISFQNLTDFPTKSIFPTEVKQKQYYFPVTHCILLSKSSRLQREIIILKVKCNIFSTTWQDLFKFTGSLYIESVYYLWNKINLKDTVKNEIKNWRKTAAINQNMRVSIENLTQNETILEKNNSNVKFRKQKHLLVSR